MLDPSSCFLYCLMQFEPETTVGQFFMMNRITPKAHAVPETNVRKGYLPPSAFGSVPSQDQDRVTIAHSPKFGMFNYLNSTTDQPAPLTPDQQTAFDAARNGRVSVLEDLYRRTKSFEFLMGKDTEKRTILHHAAIGNHTEIVDFWDRASRSGLSRLNYNWINSQDKDGQTPLHWAAMNNHKNVAVKLMASGASHTITNLQLKKPHELASSSELAQLIQNGGMKLIEPISIEPIRLQTVAPLTQNLVSQRSPSLNSNVSSHNQNVTLRKLTQGKHNPDNERQVRTLLEQGASPNEPDAYQERTALHWAAINGHNKYVEMILGYNPDLALTDKGGYTALALAENKLRELQTNSRLGLRGEKNRREDVVRRLRTAARNAGLLSNSPTIAPSSPISSTVRPPVQNNTQYELDMRSLERHRRDRPWLNQQLQDKRDENIELKNQLKNKEESRERHRTKKRDFKQKWQDEHKRADELEERLSRRDKFDLEQTGQRSSLTPPKKYSSRSLERILDSVSPTRFLEQVRKAAAKKNVSLSRSLSPTTQKIVNMLKEGILNVQLTVKNAEGASLPSAESRNVPLSKEAVESLKEDILSLQADAAWEADKQKVDANRTNATKDCLDLGATVISGLASTIATGGQGIPAFAKGVATQLNNIKNNPEAMPGFKHNVERGMEKVKSRYFPGDSFKEVAKLNKKLDDLVDTFAKAIKRAKDLNACKEALIRFELDIMHDSMGYLEDHGTNEQKQDLEALRLFANGYKEIVKKLISSDKTEENLNDFDEKMKHLIAELKQSSRLEKLVNEFIGKQTINLVDMKNVMNVPRLFGDYPKDIILKQQSGHTCYILAILDSIFHLPRAQASAILSKIKVASTPDGYAVEFPAQKHREPIQVSIKELEDSNTVSTGSGKRRGPQIIEQAYLNHLDRLPEEERNDDQDTLDALREIFGNLPTIRIQSVDRYGRPISKEPPIKAVYDVQQGGYYYEGDKGVGIILPERIIDKDQEEVRRLRNLNQTIEFEEAHDFRPAQGFSQKDKYYKLHEKDHAIGDTQFNHNERKEYLQGYIKNILNLKKEKKMIPLDIWTAIRRDRGKHYYSIRILDSTPDKICLANPMNTSKTDKIKIDKFLEQYNISGMRLDQ